MDGPPGGHAAPNAANAQRDALVVLTMAQRTADEHVANAHQEADRIINDARAAADHIVQQAEAHAEDMRADADDVLGQARADASRIVQEARAHADKTEQAADDLLADARARAAEIVKIATQRADDMKHQAEMRYQDVVGSLAAKREGLQQQIESLERFDREYRSRLTSFMQTQLRALWVDQPQVDPDIEGTAEPHDDPRPASAIPTQRSIEAGTLDPAH
ncbi:DivIVA domain-containing protein [Dactylosporangium sp. CA-139066]|uniref:DivIVA domain-containing protein n=1 Tax=Dactylosporangium sp. CA-139066 TaxID=3239930 RepID=UPI003D91730A